METVKHIYKGMGKVLGVVACCLLAACADHSYPGGEGFAQSGLVIENSKVPILIYVGRSSTNIDKASRADESPASAEDEKKNETKWNEPYIYVYSFQRTGTDDYTLAPQDEESPVCLVDNSLTRTGSKLGKQAQITTGSPYAAWTESPYAIFYPTNSVAYDFFGYYLDELNVTESDVIRTPEGISLNIDLENWKTNQKNRPVGMADLMYARAAEDSQINQLFTEGSYTEEEKKQIRNFSFSGYTAQRGIQPILQFHHAMTRIKFEIEGKYQLADGLQPYIYKIRVLDVPQKVAFTVAGKASALGTHPQENGGYISEVFLHDYDVETGVYSELPDPETSDNAYCDRTPNDNVYTQVGSYLILPANVISYRCEIWMKQKINGQWKGNYKADVVLKTSDGQPLKQGQDYTVKMDVYGWQEIKVKVDAAPWVVGGWAEIDPDKDFTKEK